ncbi:MAG: MFS transporter [Actinobacteria bacterium]|nr:MFS transporter [Actinomycetota bacterium]PLS84206.1 MAG: MFS transporter [Actinomycetota bacterium]
MANIGNPPCDEGVIRSGKGAAPCAPSSGPWILAATIIGSAMAFIDSTVVNVALPQIQTRLDATAVDAQWIVEAYALFLAALILVGGSLGDHYGRRRIYSLGVAIFALASVACGIAQDPGQLIISRAIQGIGGALLVPGSLAIISASFEGEARGKAIGTWSGFSGITAALGPVLGGYLVENVSWRAAFFINVPLAALVLLLVARHVPESRDPDARKLDVPGAVLATLGLGGIVYGLIESTSRGFGDSLVLLALALGTVSLVAFVLLERRVREPMMPLSLFKSRNFSGANLLTLLLYAGLGGSLYFLPFNLIQVHGYSATAAGAAFLPFIFVTFLLSRWAGGLVTRYGAKLPLVVGPLVAACGFVLFALPGTEGSYWTTFFPAVLVQGLGMALVIAPLTTTALNSVEGRHSGLASGVNNAVSRTAGLLAIPVLGILVFVAFSGGLDGRLEGLGLPAEARGQLEAQKVDLAAAEVPGGLSEEQAARVEEVVDESFVGAFRLIMLVSAGLAAASAVAAAVLIEGKGHPESTEEAGTTQPGPAPA